MFVSCVVLEIVGAASATIAAPANENPTAAFTGHLPGWVAALTLLGIALGAVSADVLNVYSGAMSFLALGIDLPLKQRRAIVAAVFGVIGFVLPLTGLQDAGEKYEGFLLVISYWIGPWLGVYFADWVLRRMDPAPFLYDRTYNPWSGVVAMAVGMVVSIALFCNQTLYVAPIPTAVPAVGDITFEVGFVLAAALYAVLSRRARAAVA